jgi:hypothetical protein
MERQVSCYLRLCGRFDQLVSVAALLLFAGGSCHVVYPVNNLQVSTVGPRGIHCLPQNVFFSYISI